MASKRQKNAGALLPSEITGHPETCFRMTVPDNQEYRAALLGAIMNLGKWWYWERSGLPGDRRATEAAAYWREFFLTAQFGGDCEGGGGVNGRTPELRSIQFDINCKEIQWKFQDEPETEWRTLDIVCDGLPGAPGAPGAPGECSECDPSFPPPDDPDDPDPSVRDNELCGIANYLTSWHDGIWREYLTVAGAAGTLAEALTLAATLLFTGLAGAIVGSVLTRLVAAAYAAGIGGILAAVGPTQLEEVKCKLYCILKDDGGFRGDTITRWADEVSSGSGLNFALFYWAEGLRAISLADWNLRATIGKLTPSADCALLCDECDECSSPDTADFRFNAPDLFGYQLINGGTINSLFPASSFPNTGTPNQRDRNIQTVRQTNTNWGVTQTPYSTSGSTINPMAIVKEFPTPYRLCRARARYTRMSNTGVDSRINSRTASILVRLTGSAIWQEIAFRTDPLNTGDVFVVLDTGDIGLTIDAVAFVAIAGGGFLSLKTLSLNEPLPL